MSPLLVLKTVSIALTALIMVCYGYQAVYLFLPLVAKRKSGRRKTQHRYAVLIAARNEENVLPQLLRSIQAQDYPAELVTTYVVADYCTDRSSDLIRIK